ncbi:hypothetical protein AKJ16_DCAP18972 [Drosera capensis]
MEANSKPECAEEALDLLNCAAEADFDTHKCIAHLQALRQCIISKKVKRFSLAGEKREDREPSDKQ